MSDSKEMTVKDYEKMVKDREFIEENMQYKLTMKDICLPEVYARSFPEHEKMIQRTVVIST